MEQPKKELIKEIADLFEDYEEAYVPGEWEAFSASKKKKYPFYYSWTRIAAALFLIGSLVTVYLANRDEKVVLVAARQTKHQPEEVKKTPETSAVTTNTVSAKTKGGQLAKVKPVEKAQSRAEVAQKNEHRQPESQIAAQSQQYVAMHQGGDKNEETKPTAAAGSNHTLQAEVNAGQINGDMAKTTAKDSVSANEKLSTIDFLLAESKASGAKKTKKNELSSKWDFGVQVIPAVMHDNMNVGAGLTTAYRISDKFSLSSGISFIQLEGGKNVPAQVPSSFPSASSFALSNKELLTVDANLKAIDIPLGVVYQFTKNFYTSVGVSYLNVISEKRNNTYSQTSSVSQIATNPETGNVTVFRTLLNEEIAERSSDMPLKGNSYLGYFNFSFGRRQNLFKSYHIMIEPFIKVPVGKLSNEDLKLMNSGVKFQLAF